MAKAEDTDEFLLAEKLKKYCEKKKDKENRKEIDSLKAGEIFHKIGLLYRKKENDKISLIQSAGLLNAAIFRKPLNVSDIQSDLSELCKFILQQAKAKDQNADLVKEAKVIKDEIKKMRNEVKNTLNSSICKIPEDIPIKELKELKLNKVSNIQKLNKKIANQYKNIMKKLSQRCQDIMGEPPCNYAIAGMGSLAREEITPYSDFEHIILLEDMLTITEKHLNYFRWFTVIFHVIILNVQETIIASLNIKSLEWFYDGTTPRGISLDGMMSHACKFPLGRQHATENKSFTTELIKPVCEMLQYLSSEEDLKNGYHLADILTKTCYVFGNEDIFKQFFDGVKKHQDNKAEKEIFKDVNDQVKEDLNNFSARFSITKLKSQNSINIKRFVYRSTTIFITALARIYKIFANSCFEIINEMAKNKNITENTAEKLRCSIAIACEMRLRVYMENERQCDDAINLEQDGIKKFLDIVGLASTVNYFQIAYCLQCEVAKKLNFTKMHFYSDSQLINITLGLAFQIKDFISYSNEPKKCFWDINSFDFDECIEQLEAQIWAKPNTSLLGNFRDKISTIFGFQSTTGSSILNSTQIKSIANRLKTAKVYDEALEIYKQLLHIYQNKSKFKKAENSDVAHANEQIGVCLNKLKKSKDALPYLQRALKIKETATRKADTDRSIAATLHIISRCYINLQQYKIALEHLKRELEIERISTSNAEADRNIASTLHTIGRCHTGMEQYHEALEYLYQALEIKQNADNSDKYAIAMTLHEIGRCHFELQEYGDAMTYLNKALDFKQIVKPNNDTESSIAATLHSIGRCQFELHQYENAIKYLNKALDIKEKITLEAATDKSIASTLHCIGRCQINLDQLDDAIKCLNRALEIKKKTTSDAEKDSSFAITLHTLGLCYVKKDDPANALENLKHSLKIYENLPQNKNIAEKIALLNSEIDQCNMKLKTK